MEKETTYKITIVILIAVIIGLILGFSLFPEYNQKRIEEGQMQLIQEGINTQSVPVNYFNCRAINEKELRRQNNTEEQIEFILESCKKEKLKVTWISLSDLCGDGNG